MYASLSLCALDKFQQFDYGPDVNLEVYRSTSPPEYDLKKVSCGTIYFISSDSDEIAAKEVSQNLEPLNFS